ncbi:hypothetical protein I4U23_005766 [Adineta vaga]|nr:hypothetical protein I4U23_005766 [Adineta vaga]
MNSNKKTKVITQDNYSDIKLISIRCIDEDKNNHSYISDTIGNLQDQKLTSHRNVSRKTNSRLVETTSESLPSPKSHIIHQIETNLNHLQGYSQQPLLPLSKACEPLNDIFQNLSFYVQQALNETSEQPKDGLTIDESASIRLYTLEWQSAHQKLPFEGAHLYPKPERQWYRKKRFLIPISFLMILMIGSIIIGSILGTKSKKNLEGMRVLLSNYIYNVDYFSIEMR